MLAAQKPLLELAGIHVSYGQVQVLQDVNLTIYGGELVCLLGGNASGKSTTLKTILGLARPDSGSAIFDGEAIQDKSTSYRVQRGMACSGK